ncbi:unnamed protein product, partial [Mesorhabditis belari]|uniref:Uncharacterized protein n=1 Tax=Mesorhabditis belari TaxID=2138241 RepID=A0AAF3FKA0_9BILA
MDIDENSVIDPSTVPIIPTIPVHKRPKPIPMVLPKHEGKTIPLHWRPLVVPDATRKAILRHIAFKNAQFKDKVEKTEQRKRRKIEIQQEKIEAAKELVVIYKELSEANEKLEKLDQEKHETFLKLKDALKNEAELKKASTSTPITPITPKAPVISNDPRIAAGIISESVVQQMTSTAFLQSPAGSTSSHDSGDSKMDVAKLGSHVGTIPASQALLSPSIQQQLHALSQSSSPQTQQLLGLLGNQQRQTAAQQAITTQAQLVAAAQAQHVNQMYLTQQRSQGQQKSPMPPPPPPPRQPQGGNPSFTAPHGRPRGNSGSSKNRQTFNPAIGQNPSRSGYTPSPAVESATSAYLKNQMAASSMLTKGFNAWKG